MFMRQSLVSGSLPLPDRIAAADRGAGNMRGHDAVAQAHERIAGTWRFGISDVEPGGEDRALAQGRGQIRFDHERPSSRVHEHRRGLHFGKRGGIEHAPGGVVQVGMYGDEVRVGQQPIERDALGA